jgi:hypothetical protein
MLTPSFLAGSSLVVLFLAVATFFVTLSNKEMSRPEWDLEWLVTLPVPLSTLLRVRLVERTLLNVFGLFALWPFLAVFSWQCGYRAAAPLLGLLLTYALLLLLQVVQLVLEAWLRLSLSPAKMRNLRAFFSMGGVASLYVAMSAGLPAGESPGYFLHDVARSLPQALLWLPWGLPIIVLASGSVQEALLPGAVLLGEVLIISLVGLRFLERRLSRGVVSTGVRESGGSSRPPPLQESRADAKRGKRLFLSTIQAKELRLLARDRNFMVQTLIVPVIISGMQIIFKPGLLKAAGYEPSNLAAIAFGITAYVLIFSAFQVLNAEGAALWILYSVPHRLERILAQKALLWALLALVYPVGIIGTGIIMSQSLSMKGALTFLMVLAGVPVYAMIAACLGVFASNPLDEELQRRLRPQFVYAYMLLASLYSYGIYASDLWPRVVLLTLTTLLAFALWQKARDQLPFLLDPTASPPSRVSLADGLIAALIFFVVQGLVTLMSPGLFRASPMTGLFIALALAGMITYGVERLLFWRKKTAGVPKVLGPGALKAILAGLTLGGAAAAVGMAYLYCAARWGLFPDDGLRSLKPGSESLPWALGLSVVAAPLFEEFIFRGLIFGGMRRSLGFLPSALASAAIFAVVHPPVSFVPVLALGILAALAYERTGLLLAPMLAHGIYNAVVVGYSLGMAG